MKIILGVLANDEGGYGHMIQAARDTCYETIPDFAEVFYLYGHRNNISIPHNSYVIDNDCFYYDYPEHRSFLLHKTIAFFEYCLNNKDFDYIFRPNCGSYIHLELLHKFITNNVSNERVYLGIRGFVDNINYASGSGFLISKDVVELLVRHKECLEYDGNVFVDDMSIGRLLTEHNGLQLDFEKLSVTPGALRENVRLSDIIKNDFKLNTECYHYYFCHTIDPRCFYVVHDRFKKCTY